MACLHLNLPTRIFLFLALTSSCFPGLAASKRETVDERIAEAGPHHRVVEFTVSSTNEDGTVDSRNGRYTELGTGLNRKEGDRYVPADVKIVGARGGAQARMGRLRASFAANLNSSGSVDLRGPENEKVRMHLLGLAYDDGTRRVFFAKLKDSDGKIAGDSQVVFENGLEGVQADVIYTCRLSGLEQDVILRSTPPTPASLGLSEDSELLIVTEILESPQPERSERPKQSGRPSDESIRLGGLHFGPSRAFSSAGSPDEHPARKRWSREGDRTFLIEAVPWKEIAREVASLPAESGKRVAEKGAPARPMAARGVPSMQVAQVIPTSPGFVLDYQIVDSATNFTFEPGTTYLVKTPVFLAGKTVVRGLSVTKFGKFLSPATLSTSATSPPPSITILGTIETETSDFSPAVFTAYDDDTSGEILPGSSANPAANYTGGGYANPALNILSTNSHLKFLKVYYAGALGGIQYSSGTHYLDHFQLEYCNGSFRLDGCNLNLRNGLVYISFRTFYGLGLPGHVTGQHITFSGNHLVASTNLLIPLPHTLVLTNSLLSGVDDKGSGYDSVNSTAIVEMPGAGAPLFDFYGAGWHYLKSATNRNVGVTTIDADLMADLARMTTQGPIVYHNSLFTTATTLATKIATDDDGSPDLGYHYPRIDYLMRDSTNQTTLTLSNGVHVLTFGLFGLKNDSGAKIIARGTAEDPIRMFRSPVVHEVPDSERNTSRVDGEFLKTISTGQEYDFSWTDFPSLVPLDWFKMAGNIKITAKSCNFVNGKFTLNQGSGEFLFHNSVFDATTLEGRDSTKFEFYNNGIFRGNWQFFSYASRTTANFWDNLIDNVSFGGGSIFDLRNNAVVRMASIGTGTQVLSDMRYETGKYSRFYQAPATVLLDQGSRTAVQASLYHMTVMAGISGGREGASQVDVGPHWPAVDASGGARDTDGDLIPDYLEDANGNGLSDTGESNYGGPLSTILSTENGLEVFTPLRK